MSKKRFLPPSKPDQIYALHSANGFLGQDQQFLGSLAENMETGSPHTTPRRPTPFSALWQFAADLEGKTGAALEAAARRRLRGLLALLALRSREGLALSCNVSPPFDQASNTVPIVDMLRRHIVHRSKQIVKDNRLIYLTLGGQVIAGYSPATLLFPSAKRPNFPPAICPPWFLQECGEWLDPTDSSDQISASEFKINAETIPRNAGAIRVWLDAAIAWINQGGVGLDMVLPNPNLFRSELERWRNDLEHIEPVGEISASPLAIRGDATPEVNAFLSVIVPLSLTLKGNPASALTSHKGRFLLSKSHLTNPTVRLVGNIHGSPAYDFRWAQAPAAGDHLGEALNLPPGERDSLAIPFLFVDKLFTPALSCLSDKVSGHTTNKKWRALVTDGEAYAYPLFVQAFEFFSPTELEAALAIKNSAIEHQVTVSFQLGDFHFVKVYAISQNGASPVETLDPSLDFRLFPDYDLCSLTAPEKQIPAKEDRCYHARIRMSGKLVEIEAGIIPIFEQNDKAFHAQGSQYDSKPIGNLEMRTPSLFGSGRRLVFTIRPGMNRLCGFDLGGKGLLLLRLDKPEDPQGGTPQSATVGIDFGTSNTCLSTLAGHGNARVLIPDATTTTFLNGFTPAQRDGSHEGYSADFDFFPTGSAHPGKLYGESFFPTQLASRKKYQPQDFGEQPQFDPLLALVCFESLSDFIRKDAVKVNTVANYVTNERDQREYEATVHLKDRLKWDADNVSDTAFFRSLRRIFLQHLRLQLVHSTAKSGEFISNVRASYPRAFTPFQRDTFKSVIEAIWNQPEAGYSPQIEIFTESHAAAAFLEPEDMIDHFLIDIGGGTTDICVFTDGSMKMESSVRMAADVIDRYFLATGSGALRECFFDAYQSNSGAGGLKQAQKDDLKTRFLAAGTDDFEDALVPRGLFYTLLGLSKNVTPSSNLSLIYRALNEPGIFKETAVERFFTTLAVFYGGLAYFSGLMLKEKVRAGEMAGREVRISFAGNGATHLAWLRLDNEAAVDAFLGRMFRAGSRLPDEVASHVEILSDPKASVACGLVSNNIANANVGGTESLIYDRVDGDWVKDAESTKLFDLYSKSDPSVGWDFEKSEVKILLKCLAEATPDGKIGSRRITLKTTDNWTESIITDGKSKNSMQQIVGNRLSVCRKTFAEDITAKTAGLALEPILVAELSGVFTILRNRQPDATNA